MEQTKEETKPLYKFEMCPGTVQPSATDGRNSYGLASASDSVEQAPNNVDYALMGAFKKAAEKANAPKTKTSSVYCKKCHKMKRMCRCYTLQTGK